eukprot:TRINITY_DN216_c0_g2_i2.p1 TRINITY_DN216_c0_g2~~TRINITY_DN216_c0_g2_i2.p1  ORF type:complete len:680 (-),score=242.42 TRINITY_DN216_c0_g2_i2:116-2155(-)
MQRLLLLASASLALSSQVTPIQKVIQLMENMKDKGKKEMVDEQAQFSAYKQFCETTLKEKEQSIEEATDKMDVLEADIEKASSEVKRLGKEIAAHTVDIEKATRESDEATTLRKKEKNDFTITVKDFSESIDALQRALKVLKTSDGKVSVSLVQLSTVRKMKNLPRDAMDSIDAFIAQQEQQQKQPAALLEKASNAQAPQPKTYEFQSGGVVEMVEGLLDKFEDQRVELEREESKSQHAYELLAQRLAAQVEQSKKDKGEKTEFKAKQSEVKANAQGELEETTEGRSSDTKYKDDLKATCTKKASAFDARQKMRNEEIEAIDKAQEIIASGAVAGNAERHSPSLLQIGKQRSSFAFLRSESKTTSPEQQKVARFLQKEASALNSRVLAAAAVRVESDAFEKIKTMIQGLITKMQHQLNEDAEKKGWCDKELAQNKLTREEKTDLVDTLASDKDELASSISTLRKEVQTLGKEITELTTAMREATELRLKEKNKNAATIRDAKEAQAAVAQAITVLKEFYAKAGESTALLQRSSAKQAPEIFGDEPYTGMGGEGGGIVSMMQLIESDFARLEAETSSEEEASKKEYDEFMEDSKIDKATKGKDVEFKSGKQQSKQQALKVTDDDLHSANKELDAAKAYFDKLQSKCMDSEESIAESKQTREKEIADLKEALQMLNSMSTR